MQQKSLPDSLTLPTMTGQFRASHLNIHTFAAEGQVLVAITPLQELKRLSAEIHELPPAASVSWQADAQLRSGSGNESDIWLHLQARASVMLTCQRCLRVVQTPLDVDRCYRFVATEDVALAEDNVCEEDILVLAPQFDLLALLEDELLMALPLVPMHEQCPVTLKFSAQDEELGKASPKEPHPFAALAQLKIVKDKKTDH